MQETKDKYNKLKNQVLEIRLRFGCQLHLDIVHLTEKLRVLYEKVDKKPTKKRVEEFENLLKLLDYYLQEESKLTWN